MQELSGTTGGRAESANGERRGASGIAPRADPAILRAPPRHEPSCSTAQAPAPLMFEATVAISLVLPEDARRNRRPPDRSAF